MPFLVRYPALQIGTILLLGGFDNPSGVFSGAVLTRTTFAQPVLRRCST
jgi:hypothetical protein